MYPSSYSRPHLSSIKTKEYKKDQERIKEPSNLLTNPVPDAPLSIPNRQSFISVGGGGRKKPRKYDLFLIDSTDANHIFGISYNDKNKIQAGLQMFLLALV